MHIFISLMALILSSFAYAEPIVVAPGIIEQISKKLRENEYYIKRGPAKFKIFYFDIGKPETPIYLSNSIYKRFYRNEKKCFELTIEEKLNVARRVKCHKKINQLYIAGFEKFRFTPLKDIFALGWRGFEIEKSQQKFELEAILQPFKMFSLDRHVFGPSYDEMAPRKKFNVLLSSSSKLDFTEKKIEFIQELNLNVGKIGILSERSSQMKNSISTNERTLIFSNDLGEVLIYNPYLPHPFGDYRIVPNAELNRMLIKLAEDSLSGPVCFRDDYVSPTSKDCHKILFETQKLGQYKKIQMMLVDFKNQKVSLIDQ
jgi:hypothetical protein